MLLGAHFPRLYSGDATAALSTSKGCRGIEELRVNEGSLLILPLTQDTMPISAPLVGLGSLDQHCSPCIVEHTWHRAGDQ